MARHGCAAHRVEIAALATGDIENVCALMARCFPEEAPLTASALRDYTAMGVVLVARRSGLVAGMGMLCGDWVQDLCIARRERGRGTGRQLLHALEHRGWSGGLKAIGLVAHCDVAGFYRACGYRLSPAQRTVGPEWVEMIKDRPKRTTPPWTAPANTAMLSGT
ncbi:MAG: GNAT family N-acetyltransferase [Pseudomonadota bacterium]